MENTGVAEPTPSIIVLGEKSVCVDDVNPWLSRGLNCRWHGRWHGRKAIIARARLPLAIEPPSYTTQYHTQEAFN
jgi:hypothetical protein